MHKWKPDDAWIGSVRPSDPDILRPPRAPVLAATGTDGAKTPEYD
jgi:hypothetical protein